MTRSWQKRIRFMLAALLLASVFFFAWTSVSFNREVKTSILSDNSATVTQWSRSVDDRLDSIYSHIYNLLLTIYNNTDLGYDTPMMTATTKSKIIDEMKNHLLVSGDSCVFFVNDLQNDIFLLSATTNNFDPSAVVAAKAYWRENSVTGATPLHNKLWRLQEIGGKTYFVKNIKLGKFVVGAMAETRLFDINASLSVAGEDGLCFLVTDNGVVCLSGTVPEEGDFDPAAVDTGIHGEFIVNVTANEITGGRIVLVSRAAGISNRFTLSFALVLFSAVCVLLVTAVLVFMRKHIVEPTGTLIDANKKVADGDLTVRLDEKSAKSSEFSELYKSFNDMVCQISELRADAYELGKKREEDRLTMLRAQIRPHTFLNAMTTVSNMTYMSKPEDIRRYISSFASFTRYMLNSDTVWTSLGDEARHIGNYISMQQVRSPSPIVFYSEIPDAEKDTQIPFLMLYTLVENSVKHALSLTESSEIRIGCRREDTEDFKGLVIFEEDNGAGFSEEALAELTAEVPQKLFVKEHLGLTNVRYTLNLLYHRDDLIRFINKDKGSRVEIMIPDKEERNETADL